MTTRSGASDGHLTIRGRLGYLTAMAADAGADAVIYLVLGWLAARTGDGVTAASVLAAATIPTVVVLLAGEWWVTATGSCGWRQSPSRSASSY